MKVSVISNKDRTRDFYWYFLVLCLLISIGLVITAIFRGTLATFHSDDAIAVLLAREQLATGQIIPKDWSYAYEYWVLSLNLLVLPFLKLTGQMLLSRELAVVVQFICMELVFYHFARQLVSKKNAVLCCILTAAPLSFLQMEHFYFQATYATTITWGFVVLLLAVHFLRAGADALERRKSFVCGIVLAVLIILLGCGGTRILGTVLLPMLGALAVVALVETDYSVPAVLKQRTFVIKVAVICIAIVLGLLAGNRLMALGQTQGDNNMTICKTSQLSGNLSAFLVSLLQTYGCLEAETLMSASGILGVFKMVLAVACGMGIPVVLLIRFFHLSRGQKFFVAYAFFEFLVIFYMMVFCGLTNSYYYLPIYINNILLTCIFIEHFQEKLAKIFSLLVPYLLVPIAVFSCVIYAKYNYASVEWWAGFHTVDMGLLGFLQEEGLEYGYSDFFDAQAYTVASNGAVEIVSVNEEYIWSDIEERYMAVVCHPSHARQWLSSKRWYEVEYHPGESFVLTRTEFLDKLMPVYIEGAERILTYNEYTILVYEHNLRYYNWE